MTISIVVPSLGESITEATLAKWHCKVGDQVNIDEVLVEIETDKVTLEVSAEITGTISKILFKEGDTITVGDIIGSIDEESAAITVNQQTEKEKDTVKSEFKAKKEVILSPAARKIAIENDLQSFSHASGKGGRITKSDVLAELSNRSPKVIEDTPLEKDALLEKRVKMTRLRKTIAQRLKESQNTAATLSTFNEVDMTAAINYRKKYQEIFKEKHDVKLGFMSFFIKAAVAALQEIPVLNAQMDVDDIVYKNYYNIGVAVGTEQGLVVPVLRNADKMNHAQIEKEIAVLGKKARDTKLSMHDMTGGTFSITNGGIYGSLLSTPIINPPQSGILGLHNIVPKPVAIEDKISIRPMMYIALSYDHRIIDGREAVTFLKRIKELVEDPDRILFNL